MLSSSSGAGSWSPAGMVRSQDPSPPPGGIPVLSCGTGAEQRMSCLSANDLRDPPVKKRYSLWGRWQCLTDLCTPLWNPLTNKCVWNKHIHIDFSWKTTLLCLSSASQSILIHLDTAPFLVKDAAVQIYSCVFHQFSWLFLIESRVHL